MCYIVKNGSWLKCIKTNKDLELKIESLNEAQQQSKPISHKYDLDRWYFFFQQANGLAHQGYLDASLQRFKSLLAILREPCPNVILDSEEFNASKREQILAFLLNELKVDKSNADQTWVMEKM